MYTISLTDKERNVLQECTRNDSKLSSRKRAKVILLAASGCPYKDICYKADVSINTVTTYIKEFDKNRMSMFTKPGPHAGAPEKYGACHEWIREIAATSPSSLIHNFKAPKQLSILDFFDHDPDSILESHAVKRNGNWTLKRLTDYIRTNCASAGYPILQHISESKVYSILKEYPDGCYKLDKRTRSVLNNKNKKTLRYFWDDTTLDLSDIRDLVETWKNRL